MINLRLSTLSDSSGVGTSSNGIGLNQEDAVYSGRRVNPDSGLPLMRSKLSVTFASYFYDRSSRSKDFMWIDMNTSQCPSSSWLTT